MSRSTVVIELESNTRSYRDLAAGGVYIPGCGLRLAEECDLVVCGAHHQILLPARVVYVDDHRGAGLELIGFSLEMKARIAELEPLGPSDPSSVGDPQLEESELDRSSLDDPALDQRRPPEDDLGYGGFHESSPLITLEALDDDLSIPLATEHSSEDDLDTLGDTLGADADANADPAGPSARVNGDASLDDTLRGAETQAANTDRFDTLDPDEIARRSDHADDAARAGRHEHARGTRPIARNVHERLRGLTLAAQIKMATSGELHERIVLERLYGKNVWETLLRNPRLSPPEVSRIARYGSLPRVLLEIIVGNNAWLQVPEVRRALLSNPRLGTDQIMKVLRLMPKHELKLAAIQTVYSHAVRNVAKMLMRGD